MNILLWLLQGFLAAIFLYSGFCKSTLPRERLVTMGQTGVSAFSTPAIRAIGVVEVLGAVGIVLPWALQTLPALTPVSAAGFATIMVPASIIHARRGEPKNVALNAVIFCLSAVVAAARFEQL